MPTIAPCGRDAALYAVTHWHYTKKLPVGRLVYHGVWELDQRYTGTVIYGRGANDRMSKMVGLTQVECAELVRVALRDHTAPVTQILAESIRLLRSSNPGLRAIISYADPGQGHHGGIYQAGNWLYLGLGTLNKEFVIHGRQMHLRSVHAAGWKQSLAWVRANVDPRAYEVTPPRKHRYVYPLDKPTRRKTTKLSLPYPSAVEASEVTRPGSIGEGRVQLPATAQHSPEST